MRLPCAIHREAHHAASELAAEQARHGLEQRGRAFCLRSSHGKYVHEDVGGRGQMLRTGGTHGAACAFSPAGDVLATGGDREPIVLHELRPQEAGFAPIAAEDILHDLGVISMMSSTLSGHHPSSGGGCVAAGRLRLGTRRTCAGTAPSGGASQPWPDPSPEPQARSFPRSRTRTL